MSWIFWSFFIGVIGAIISGYSPDHMKYNIGVCAGMIIAVVIVYS